MNQDKPEPSPAPDKWGASPPCQRGEHGWCMNRTLEESHCTCPCHAEAQEKHDRAELTRLKAKYEASPAPDVARLIERFQNRAQDLRNDAADWRESADRTGGHTAHALVRDAITNEKMAEKIDVDIKALAALQRENTTLREQRDAYEAELVGWNPALTNTPRADRTPTRIIQQFRADLGLWLREREDAMEAVEALRQALRDVLSRFGNDEAIRGLVPEGAEHVRSWPMDKSPKVADVQRWRKALASVDPLRQAQGEAK